MKKFTKEIQLPSFHGFYGSIWSADEWDGYELAERGIELIDQWRISDNYYTDVAKAYTEEIEQMYREYLGVDIRLKFTELVSPTFYNYTTDKIYCELFCEDGEKFQKRIIELVRRIIPLAEYVRKNHSSCEGFISFMSNNIDDWMHEFMGDELQLGCLLHYLLDYCYRNNFRNEDFEYWIWENLRCNGYTPDFYAEPDSDAAREELVRIELKEAQEEALRLYQYKLAFPNF